MLAAIVAVSKVMPRDKFITEMRASYEHKFAKKPEVIDGNMKALEMIKAIEKVAECDEVVIDDVDVLMMINVVHDYLKDNYRIFDDCK